MSDPKPLPPGQFELGEFPRFGLGKFAAKIPAYTQTPAFDVRGDVASPLRVGEQLRTLPRVEQCCDFNCVTTWSVRNVNWAGWRFADFYQQIVCPQVQPAADALVVVLRGGDGYANSLQLADLLAPDVLLADRIDGRDLGPEHGAPLRLVAPAHYGYKSVKHISAIEFWRDRRAYRFPRPYPGFMDHPRARVAFEERGIGVPAWLLRLIYRPMVRPNIRKFSAALKRPSSGVD
jgi:DMSO/TMAO reductase YedYZ molybdopterin-dependent catalytic subunit